MIPIEATEEQLKRSNWLCDKCGEYSETLAVRTLKDGTRKQYHGTCYPKEKA